MHVLLGSSVWQRSARRTRRYAHTLPLHGSFMDMLSRNVRAATHTTLNLARDLTAKPGTGAPPTNIDISVRNPETSGTASDKIFGLPRVGVYAAGGLLALVVVLGMSKRR